MPDLAAQVAASLRDVPDFPTDGILFKDITPLLMDPALFGEVIGWYAGLFEDVDKVVGVESRGFPFAGALVQRLDAGLVLARKAGKLPWKTVRTSYSLEYGEAVIEMHADAVAPGDRVLIVDDLLATGGTARATVELVRRLGGTVLGVAVVTELGFLNGRDAVDCPVQALLTL